jgi:hypothetical protein
MVGRVWTAEPQICTVSRKRSDQLSYGPVPSALGKTNFPGALAQYPYGLKIVAISFAQ